MSIIFNKNLPSNFWKHYLGIIATILSLLFLKPCSREHECSLLSHSLEKICFYHREPLDTFNVSQLTELLANKSISMIGDSLMEQIFRAVSTAASAQKIPYAFSSSYLEPFRQNQMVRFLSINTSKILNLEIPPPVRWDVMSFHNGCTFNYMRFYRRASLQYLWPRDLAAKFQLYDAHLDFLGHNSDIIIFNAGVHYHDNFSMLVSDVTAIAKHLAILRKPVIIRETFPTHFATEDGMYVHPKVSLSCVSIRNVTTQEKVNEYLFQVSLENNFNFWRVFSFFKDRFDLHPKKGDCVHWDTSLKTWTPILMSLEEVLLSMVCNASHSCLKENYT